MGRSFSGLAIVGQAVYGWPDEWPASKFQPAANRADVIATTMARNADRPEPLDWIESSPKRTSQFWSPDSRRPARAGRRPSHARIAWVNLYPNAPEDPPGDPGGALREAQDPTSPACSGRK